MIISATPKYIVARASTFKSLVAPLSSPSSSRGVAKQPARFLTLAAVMIGGARTCNGRRSLRTRYTHYLRRSSDRGGRRYRKEMSESFGCRANVRLLEREFADELRRCKI